MSCRRATGRHLALATLIVVFSQLLGITAFAADKIAARGLERLTPDERRVALVIGNAAYDNQPLKNPVNDARAMARTLSSLGFEVLEAENTTRRDMQRAILKFGEKLTDGGVGLFYYAGHGMEVRGTNYLIPVDENITSEASVRFEGISLDAVLEQMGQPRPNRTNIVILDACRNNPYASRFGGNGAGLALVDAPVDFLVAYATAPGRVAVDGSGANGLYTSEILKAIKTPGIEIEDVFKMVRSAVSQKTRHAQTPWEASSLVRSFSFTIESPAEKPPVVQQQQTVAAADSSQRSVGNNNGGPALELAFWDAIKNSKDPAVYEAYLEAYPKGTFAPLARLRASQLKQTEAYKQSAPTIAPAAEPKVAAVVPTAEKPVEPAPPPKQETVAKVIQPAPAPVKVAPKKVDTPVKVPEKPVRVADTPVKVPDAPVKVITKVEPPKAEPKKQEQLALLNTSKPATQGTASFQDCTGCPEMVPLPSGRFIMGSKSVGPPHQVVIGYKFAMGRYEVTLGNWKECVSDGGCAYTPKLKGATDQSPVRNISWTDAQTFVSWLRKKTGKPYRLPTEAEWEYAARASSQTNYPWGNQMSADKANCVDCGGAYNRKAPSDAGLYDANAFGLHDMVGGVWEWVEDCWNPDHQGAANDGKARVSSGCLTRVLRGGSWKSNASGVRSDTRFYYDYSVRYFTNGFRVALSQ